jgi:hypothetical protein
MQFGGGARRRWCTHIHTRTHTHTHTHTLSLSLLQKRERERRSGSVNSVKKYENRTILTAKWERSRHDKDNEGSLKLLIMVFMVFLGHFVCCIKSIISLRTCLLALFTKLEPNSNWLVHNNFILFMYVCMYKYKLYIYISVTVFHWNWVCVEWVIWWSSLWQFQSHSK